jgi:hypothetical protein
LSSSFQSLIATRACAVVAGDVAVDQAAEAFAGVFVHYGHDLDRRPSVVASNWTSTAHTAFGASATGTVPRSRRRGRLRRRR